MLFTNNLLYDSIGISVGFLTVLIAFFKWPFSYWKRKGLVCPEPYIPFGNILDLILVRKSLGEIWRDIYLDLKSKGFKHGGSYLCATPIYVPVDNQLVKNILQTNFEHFVGRGLYVNDKVDPLTANLFILDGRRWRAIRTKLTPTFTSSKMKMMFGTLVECSYSLVDILQESAKTKTVVNIRDLMARFTTDIIGSCAFGIKCDSLKNPESEFRIYGIKSLNADLRGTILVNGQFLLPHSVYKFFKLRMFRPEVANFFQRMVEETVRYREENNIFRNDFLQLLIQLKNEVLVDGNENASEDAKGKLTLNEIIAQCFLFFLAGFETSSTTMTYASYELALNPEVQETVRQEIEEVLKKHDNKLTYAAIMEMTYLEKVICETLRKHPPVPILFRTCNKAYKVPDTDFVIEEGTGIFISAEGIHQDPEYYPEPDKFDPERFSKENKSKRPPFAWLPFGEGPRVCIGLRFAMMQTKVGLISLLRNFRITLNKKTKIPVTATKKGFISAPEEDIWIDVYTI